MLAAVVLAALVNFLAYRHPLRWDLSEAKAHSLSQETRKVLGTLKSDVKVLVFAKDIRAKDAQSLLALYRDASSFFFFSIIDPERHPLEAQKFQVSREGQAVVQVAERHELVDQINEQNLTNSILKLAQKKVKTVYFLEGHGEKDSEGQDEHGLARAAEALRMRNYTVKTLALATEKGVPEDAALVLVPGPARSFLGNEVASLESYLAQGGSLFLLADPGNEFNAPFLGPYGLALDGDVVLDVSGLGQILGLGPAVPVGIHYSPHPVTEPLGRMMTFFPMAQSVSLGKGEKGVETQGLVYTTEAAWGEMDKDVSPSRFDEGRDKKGPLALVAASSKRLEKTPGEKTAREARVIVAGDSDFASNAYFGEVGNGDLFLNAVNWLAGNEPLISIRAKSPKDRRIMMNAWQTKALNGVVLYGLPMLALAAGFLVWMSRRERGK